MRARGSATVRVQFPWNQTVQAPGRAQGPRGDYELRLVSSQAADTAWEGGEFSNTRSFTSKPWATRINIQGAAEFFLGERLFRTHRRRGALQRLCCYSAFPPKTSGIEPFTVQKRPRLLFPRDGAYYWRRPTFAQPRDALSSGLQRFTSVFGMGTGGATAL
jgi:hypothetical protein